MTDWEKYAIIGTGLASAYLLLKPKAKPKEEYPYPPTPAYPTYEPPTPQPQPIVQPTYEPPPQPMYPPQPTVQPIAQPTYEQPPPQPQYITVSPTDSIPARQVIYRKQPIYIEKEIPIPPKLISSPEQKIQQDIDILTERKELMVRLKALEDQRNKIKDDIINMTIL